MTSPECVKSHPKRKRTPELVAGVLGMLVAVTGLLQAQPTASVRVALDQRMGALEMGRFALGQGGLSEDPIWDGRIAGGNTGDSHPLKACASPEISACPQYSRVLLSEYYSRSLTRFLAVLGLALSDRRENGIPQCRVFHVLTEKSLQFFVVIRWRRIHRRDGGLSFL